MRSSDARLHGQTVSATAGRDRGDAEQRAGQANGTQGINERCCMIADSFNGEQARSNCAFQFKSATKTANEVAYRTT